MDDTQSLITEMRESFQLPPYMGNTVIEQAIRNGKAYLTLLNPLADFETDLVGRELLKNYAYYELHHQTDEFTKNYADDIRTWQLTQEVTTGAE